MTSYSHDLFLLCKDPSKKNLDTNDILFENPNSPNRNNFGCGIKQGIRPNISIFRVGLSNPLIFVISSRSLFGTLIAKLNSGVSNKRVGWNKHVG